MQTPGPHPTRARKICTQGHACLAHARLLCAAGNLTVLLVRLGVGGRTACSAGA